MTVSTYHNGNKIIWNEEEKEWYHTDGSKANYFKSCPKCGKLPTKEGFDNCLGKFDG